MSQGSLVRTVLLVALGPGAAALSEVRLLAGDSGLANSVTVRDRHTGELLGDFLQGGVPGGPFGFRQGPDGSFYVSGFSADAVYRFDAAGNALGAFVPGGLGGLANPYDVEFGPDGHLYVADFDNSRILRYDGNSGAFLGAFVPAGIGGLDHPHQLRFRAGHLYVSHWGHSILRYDAASGAFLGAFVAFQSGGLDTPVGFDWGPDGHLYVVSQDSWEILKYDGVSGAFLGEVADLFDDFYGSPRWLAFDAGPDPDLYVSTGAGIVRYDWATGQPMGYLLDETDIQDARYLALIDVDAADCNGNQQLDTRDIATGDSADCNGNGVPDECEVGEVPPVSYALDDGTRSVSIGLSSAGEIAWLNHFTVTADRETIAAVELTYGSAPVGRPVTVCVWSDPDGDANPADAVVLASAAASVANPNENVFATVDVPDVHIGPPGTGFFVGAIFSQNGGEAPAPLDQSSTHARSWVVAGGAVDPNNLAAAPLFGVVDIIAARPGNWMVRALPAPPAVGGDCNANGVPDGCDIATGASADANDDGVPDECQPCLDVDGDGDFDATDLALFFGCLAGPQVPGTPDCAAADLDLDGDIDLFDFAAAQPSCAP